MKIAIIGGGAAGMISAYYLDKNGHEVEVFEKQDFLGGNIRTLNKNVRVDGLPKDHLLEGGVIEFSDGFVNFRALLDELGIPYESRDIGTGLFLKDGSYCLSSIMIRQNFKGWARLPEYLKLAGLYASSIGFGLKLKNKKPEDFIGKDLSALLGKDGLKDKWMRVLMMYSYSTSYELLGDFSAEMALNNLQKYMLDGWYSIKGGVYSYIEEILNRFQGKVHLNTSISGVSRNDAGISLKLKSGENLNFDKIVFATPPDQILKLLTDSNQQETRFFSAWQGNQAETVIHSDPSVYKSYNITNPSEFDFFELNSGWAYNALLNRVCGISPEIPYFLSFNLEDRIDPGKVIQTMKHQTPLYTAKSMQYRQDVIAANGKNHTYFAGAWLGDGLHEGAVNSALEVAKLIG